MTDRVKVLTVTIHDCEVQTFRAGGSGGQHQNKTSSGVRVIHHPSGARGESREHREQLRNKRAAFTRMAESPKFRYWVAVMTDRIEADSVWLGRMLADENLKVEVRGLDGWVEVVDD